MAVFKTITDDTLREMVQHGDAKYPFAYYLEDIWQFDFHCIDWHWHHELEFVYIRKGAAVCFAGTEKMVFTKGYGLFINSSVLHRFEASESMVFPNIVFSPALLSPEGSLIYEKYILPVITSSVTCQLFSPQVEWQRQILQLMETLFHVQEAGDADELRTLQLLLQFWDILCQNVTFTPRPATGGHQNFRQARLQFMMQYIQEHYTEDLTLDEIAAAASVSKSSTLQIFKTGIQVSPVAYLIRYRLSRAAQQLSETEKSVSSIAEETGFQSAGYFCRKFRQYYHATPNEYRKQKLEFQSASCLKPQSMI